MTPARVVSGSTTYAVANITSVKAQTDNKLQLFGVAAVLVGLAIALGGTTAAVLSGAAVIVVGVLLVVYGKVTEVMLTTGAAEQAAFRSRDQKLALEVASSINLAIMKRSAMLGR